MIFPELLRHFSLFAGIDPAALKDIAMASEEVSVQAGDSLFFEGERANALYLIVAGSVEVVIALDEAGTRHTDLSRLVEGDIVGWSALVEPYVYTMGAVSKTDSKVIRLDAVYLRDMMNNKPEVGYRVMCRLAQAMGQRLTNLRIQFISLSV